MLFLQLISINLLLLISPDEILAFNVKSLFDPAFLNTLTSLISISSGTDQCNNKEPIPSYILRSI